ncbi:hypothetical protein D7X48_10615 [bacterium D16-50]|nr:hypothetical protein [Lachnospiraceae bacterium]RKJ20092.1 hypothetical protein D7X48_10615 [bacterium D16-50]
MLNEERVILMTRMVSYEKNEGKKNVKVGNYFRSDYIAVQILKSVICATIAFCIIFGLYLLCNLEELMQEIYTMDLFAYAKNILTYYVAAVVGYGAVTYVACSWKYSRAKRSLKNYYHNLKKLNSLYSETK